jgi:hypothetical protein
MEYFLRLLIVPEKDDCHRSIKVKNATHAL